MEMQWLIGQWKSAGAPDGNHQTGRLVETNGITRGFQRESRWRCPGGLLPFMERGRFPPGQRQHAR